MLHAPDCGNEELEVPTPRGAVIEPDNITVGASFVFTKRALDDF
jgi:hypothetical protein